MQYWLMKTEPDECSIDDVLGFPGRKTPWSGVRNYQARNFMLKEMSVGDGVLFYHSSCPEPGIAGLAAAYEVMERLRARRPFQPPTPSPRSVLGEKCAATGIHS